MNDFNVFITEDTGPARWLTAARTDDLCFILGPTWSREKNQCPQAVFGPAHAHWGTCMHGCPRAHKID